MASTISLSWFRSLLLLLTLSAGSCKHDSDTIEPEDSGTEEPIVPPTTYNLVLPSRFPQSPTQPADNPLTVEGVELGRHLFYEKALSLDNTVACASCHRQELAFTDGLGKALGVNQARATRGSMSLGNMLWEPSLNWDGAATTLELQARIPIENVNEMHQPLAAGVARLQQKSTYVKLFRKAFGVNAITEANTLKALAQFERTLISGNSRYDRYMRGERTLLTPDEVRGLVLFTTHPEPSRRLRGGNCSDCHGGERQTNGEFSNNGLDAALTDLGQGAITGRATDNGKFRVPSLRNIALTAPYMHDGRFATLEEVVEHYDQHVARNSPNIDPLLLNATNNSNPASPTLGLTDTEKKQIVAFMKTLTDSTFIRDPRFAKPTP